MVDCVSKSWLNAWLGWESLWAGLAVTNKHWQATVCGRGNLDFVSFCSTYSPFLSTQKFKQTDSSCSACLNYISLEEKHDSRSMEINPGTEDSFAVNGFILRKTSNAWYPLYYPLWVSKTAIKQATVLSWDFLGLITAETRNTSVVSPGTARWQHTQIQGLTIDLINFNNNL